MPRARDLGVTIGTLPPGPLNAITDVPGVRVGHTTLIQGDGPLAVGRGPVCTGVTVVLPHGGDIGADPRYAGFHILNGNGEMTGLPWLDEAGLLTSPVAITNTHSVGVVRDAIVAYSAARKPEDAEYAWSLPVVAETWDGWLSDINGMHVRPEHVAAALDGAREGPVEEGCVGGGTGMICHGFKGGIGTASRVVGAEAGTPGWTVGALVQANHGQRRLLRVDGVPVGRLLGPEAVPLPWAAPVPGGEDLTETQPEPGTGSIIVVVATDAPLLPHQCRRLARRASIGVVRAGGLGEDSSGDLFLAFATANRGLAPGKGSSAPIAVQTLPSPALTPLFEAAADTTEEAILNALCAATTTTGVDGRTAHALPHDRLREVLQRFGTIG